jgi:glycosyltransferase involved in cell wall biosynthesis
MRAKDPDQGGPSRSATRVLEVIDTTDPGGAETVVLQLATALNRCGWACTVAVPESGWIRGAVERRKVPFVETPVSGGAFDLPYLTSLIRAIRRRRIQLVHAHLLGPSVYGTLAARVTGVPAVCTFHGGSDVATAERFRRLKALILGYGAARLVFVSEALKRELQARLRLRPPRLEVVENGIDLGAFTRRPDDGLRRELGLGSDTVLVGAVGHGRPEKAYETFVEAAARLNAGDREWCFVIVGELDPTLQARLRGLAAGLGLGERVRLLGARTDIARIMNNLDLYALTSRSEGFSLSTIEALACGVPVVATRCGGPEDFIEHEATGLLVDVGAPEQVAAAVRRLVDDRTLRGRLATAGELMVRRRYSLDGMVDRYQRVFRSVTGATPKA